MRRVSFVVVGVAVLLLASIAGVVAQSSFRLLPTVVTVNQVVPTNVTVTGIVNGQAVTLTAPINVAVAMQIKLEPTGATGTGQPSAAPAAATPATQSDARGIPYRVDARPPLALLSATSSVNGLGWIDIVGEIQNTGSGSLEYVKAIITLYKDGKVVGTMDGYTSLDQLAPGQSSPFRATSTLKGEQVTAYMVQLQGRPVR